MVDVAAVVGAVYDAGAADDTGVDVAGDGEE